ncbi:hypothetical protein CPT_Stills69 [Bacillus phage Stills]|uniref:Uncharacterized protein n=1 Tax=Bacillus phage Stills TaxID=1610833 RepID=A0A0E3X9M7_9CAUD|nr:hypothetical protein CPT_Stills69 [Bacillus phage Stills]AKC02697.1 hypothetical protein CPT_Stills69 [Bacillus phage Stills]
MGVDYYACKSCEDTFPDCGYHVSCECGHHWCSDDCAEGDGYEHIVDEERNHETISCNFCRGEDVDDSDLLAAFLHMTKMTRTQAVEWYNKVQVNKENK